jgi:hypothetical protein
MLKSIFAFLGGFSTSFNDFEMAVVEAVGQQLSEALRKRMHLRIESLTRVHRFDGGREVIGYQKKSGKILFPDETRLTANDGSTLLASFTVHSRSSMSRLKGKVWLNHGNLTSLEFNLPTEHAEVGEIERIDVAMAKGFVPLA